ncbi:Hsp20/alpha crystallin family protein [Pendulispora rubella]|uniref:Hsp20/alpha crystallin family protein n=1 Tax=Pendulispora rubella TaxID=2741070 RepID=A0ABZ2L1X0_9BACT
MLTRWDAVSTLDHLFDDVMGSMLGTATSTRTFDPSIDVRTSENDVVFVCDVPGVKQEDLDVTLENHVLTIKGIRRFESKEGEQAILGRAYGAFSRAFSLADHLDDANLSAQLVDGVLTIRIPKQAKARPRKIQIGNGKDSKQLTE